MTFSLVANPAQGTAAAVDYSKESKKSIDAEHNVQVTTQVGSTQSYIRKTLHIENGTFRATGGAPEVLDSATGKALGFLPYAIKTGDGSGYHLQYSMLKNGDVQVEATRYGFTEYGAVGCAAKSVAAGALAGAVGGGTLGLLGRPFAEVTVPAGMAGGAIEGAAGGLAGAITSC